MNQNEDTTEVVIHQGAAVANIAEDFMPVLSIGQAVQRRDYIVAFVSKIMKPDVDFGKIPGTSRDVLLKPGAEKLCVFFGLSPEFICTEFVEDWTGEGHGGEPFFYYKYKCRLSRNGRLLGDGEGSCNSWESKYRYRSSERLCPACGKGAIIKGREEYGGGWLCFARKGGCGAKYEDGDEAIEGQKTGRVANPDIADIVNTIQKMAQKRALVASTLIATSASEFYTQDVEDQVGAPEPESRELRRQSSPGEGSGQTTRQSDLRPKTAMFKAMKDIPSALGVIGDLKAQLAEQRGAEQGEMVYRAHLDKHHVKKANEFKTVENMRACAGQILDDIKAYKGQVITINPEFAALGENPNTHLDTADPPELTKMLERTKTYADSLKLVGEIEAKWKETTGDKGGYWAVCKRHGAVDVATFQALSINARGQMVRDLFHTLRQAEEQINKQQPEKANA